MSNQPAVCVNWPKLDHVFRRDHLAIFQRGGYYPLQVQGVSRFPIAFLEGQDT